MALFSKVEKEQKDPIEEFQKQIEPYLQEGEHIEKIYPLIISFFCITSKRFIFVEKDISFKEPKTMIYTIPFSKVEEVALVYNDAIKLIQKNEIILTTKAKKHDIEFFKNVDIAEIYNEINKKIL